MLNRYLYDFYLRVILFTAHKAVSSANLGRANNIENVYNKVFPFSESKRWGGS
jgi:hypothetical protein